MNHQQDTHRSQRELIAARRRAWQPTEIQGHIAPMWFTMAIRRGIACGLLECRETHPRQISGFQLIRQTEFAYLFDHGGRIGVTAIGEPYREPADVLPNVRRLADILGCHYDVSRLSWHFPGETCRVTFYNEVKS